MCACGQVLRDFGKTGNVWGMSKPSLILATAASMPNLYASDEGLLDFLADQGLDPRIEVWNDPNVDWAAADAVVVRSVVDYAFNRDQFLQWARSVPRIVNQADVLDWNSDKHYLIELGKRGVELIPTTWLDAEKGYSKIRVDSRFPALGDFVLKPTVSSGGRDVARYCADFADQRRHAVNHAMQLLRSGRDLMLQRYEASIEEFGEISFVFFNGLLSHAVEKRMILNPEQFGDIAAQEVTMTPHDPSLAELQWIEVLRRAIHSYIRDRLGHDEQVLYLRADIVPVSKERFLLMEVALTDVDLYLDQSEYGLENFANAISARVFW